jgi:hypothetical protein
MAELTEWQDNFLYGLVSRLLLVDLRFMVSICTPIMNQSQRKIFKSDGVLRSYQSLLKLLFRNITTLHAN